MYPEPHPVAIGGRLIHIDIDPLQLVTQFPADVPIVADSRLAATAMLAALPATKAQNGGAARAATVRADVDAHLWPACATHRRIMQIVDQALPDAIVAGDQTEPVYCSNQFYQAARPRSYFNSSTGYGTLGYGMPAAFGAKLGAPDRPVIALMGDGGIQFSIQEIAAAVEAGIGVAVLVWNNSSYGEIKAFMADRDIPQIGVDIFTPDFLTVAKGLGCEASRPESIEELRTALRASAGRNVPTLIEIKEGSALAQELRA
jgi:acetolactate synthase-1/2/3 large subunit